MHTPSPSDSAASFGNSREYSARRGVAKQFFDDLTRLAAQICGVPISLITLLGTESQSCESSFGFNCAEAPRVLDFCAHAIEQPDIFVTPDALLDERFRANPLVISEPHLRFFAGMPLRTTDGHALGTLGVIDHVPRELGIAETEGLRALARQATANLESLRNAAELNRMRAEYLRTQRALRESSEFNDAVLNSLTAHVAVLDGNGNIVFVNEAWNRFAEENGGCAVSAPGSIGENYLEACSRVSDGASEARAAADGIRAVIGRSQPHFALEYPCHSPSHKRWFVMSVTPLSSTHGGVVVSHREVTERRSAEDERAAASEALHDSEERFRTAFEDAPIGILLVGLDHKILRANKSICELLNYSEQELTALTFDDITHPEDLETDVRYAEQLFEGARNSYKLEKRYLKKNGETVWIDLTATVVRDRNGNALYAMGMIENAMPRKLAEEVVRESRRFAERVSEHSPDMIYVFDLDTMATVYANRDMADFLGYGQEQIRAMGEQILPTIIHPEDLPFGMRHFEEFETKADGESVDFEQRVRNAGGEWRRLWHRETIFKRKPDGTPCQIVGTAQDITARKEAEESLREAHSELVVQIQDRTADVNTAVTVLRNEINERRRAEENRRHSDERFRLAARATSDVVWDCNLLTNELWRSENFQTRFGYAPEEEKPDIESSYGHIHPEDRERVVAGIHAVIDTGEHEWEDEYRYVCADTTYAYILDRGYVVRDAAGRPVRMVGAMTDITERKRAEEERALLLRRVVVAQEEERSRVARDLHDNMGQHLAGLMLQLNSLKNFCSSESSAADRLQQSLDVANQIAQEAHRLAWELRPAVLEDWGLHTALTTHLDEWSKSSGIKADFYSPALAERRFPPEVETTVYRIVQEALTNVMKHARARQVSLILEHRQSTLLAVVEDDGQGFDTRRSLEASHAERRLGLIGMRERAASVGGTVTIESTPGSGTTVFVRIPLGLDEEGAQV